MKALYILLFVASIYFVIPETIEEIPFNKKEINRLLTESKNFDSINNDTKANYNSKPVINIPKSTFNSDLKVISSAFSQTSVLNSALVENVTNAKLSINANSVKGDSLKSSTIVVNEIHSTKGLITINGNVLISNNDVGSSTMRFKQTENIESVYDSTFEQANRVITNNKTLNVHHTNELLIDDINQWYLYYIDSFDVLDKLLWKDFKDLDIEQCGKVNKFLSSLNYDNIIANTFDVNTTHEYIKIHFGLNLMGEWKNQDYITVMLDDVIVWKYTINDFDLNGNKSKSSNNNCNKSIKDFAIGM